jgi:hypothetical protein
VVQGADVGAGLQAGRLTDGHVQHDANGGATNVWLELRLKPSATAATDPAALLPAELAGAAAVFWTTPSNTLAAYNGPTPTIIATATFATDRWTRVTVNCDYVARRWSLWLDDAPAIAGFAFYSAAPAAGCTGFGLIEREGGGDAGFDNVRLAASPPGDDDGDGLPDTWERAFFGDLSQTPGGDWDGDGFLNGDEYLAGTDATNAASLLAFTRIEQAPDGGTVLRWQSVAGRSYRLQFADALPPAWTNRATGLPATPPSNVYTDRTDTTPAFYRLLLE